MHNGPAARVGRAPALSTEGPQRQLDQQSPPEIWGRLVAGVFELPGVEEGHSQVSPASSRAVFLADRVQQASPERSLAPGGRLEPVHLHGVGDTSIHLVLPPARGADLVRLGWAVPHEYGDFGIEFLVYGPRDDKELGVVIDIVRESLLFASSAP